MDLLGLRAHRSRLRRVPAGKADGIAAATPVARDHGEHFDLHLAVELAHHHAGLRRELMENAGAPSG